VQLRRADGKFKGRMGIDCLVHVDDDETTMEVIQHNREMTLFESIFGLPKEA
jgi:predicted ATP-dependent endonuclease of OLD family